MQASRRLKIAGLGLVLFLAAGCQAPPVAQVRGASVPAEPQSRQASPPNGAAVAPAADPARASPGAPNRVEQRAASSAELTVPGDVVIQESEIVLQAAGFTPGETAVIAADAGADKGMREVTRATVDGSGRLSEQHVTLPDWLTSGEHRLTITGDQSGRHGEAPLLIRAKDRWIQIKQYALKPTDKLGFVAGGFVPGEQVGVFLGESREPLTTLQADKVGNVAWTELALPLRISGDQLFRLVGGEGELRQTILIQPFHPVAELSPWSGPPGSSTKLNLTGFAPGETVKVYLGEDTQPALTLKADEWGNVWAAGPVAIAANRTGEGVTISAVGDQSGARVASAYSLHRVAPWGELSSYAGYPGSVVIFSGGGFAAGERIAIHAGDRRGPVVAVATTDDQGWFEGAGPVTIPADATTNATFVYAGEKSGAEASATFSVIVLPTIPGIQLPPPQQQPNGQPGS